MSGSGPTLWALYPSLDDAELAAASVRAAVATGFIASPGEDAPFVAATTFLTTTDDPTDDPKTLDPRPQMTRQAIQTNGAPAALGPYSQAIRSGDLVFCSGQLGLDPATGELADGVEAQADRALRNLQSVLDAAGLGFDDVVKTTIFLADVNDFAAVNAVYAKFMPTRRRPARRSAWRPCRRAGSSRSRRSPAARSRTRWRREASDPRAGKRFGQATRTRGITGGDPAPAPSSVTPQLAHVSGSATHGNSLDQLIAGDRTDLWASQTLLHHYG